MTRFVVLVIYLMVGMGSAARVYKDTNDVGFAWVGFIAWPAAIGYRLAENGPRPTPSKETT